MPQEPAVPPEGQGVDDDIQGHHQDRPQDEGAPRPLQGGGLLQKEPSSLPATRGQGHQRQGIAGIGQEDIGQGIHEGHPGHPEFPVQGGGDVEVLAKGKAEVNGAELRRPGDEIAQNQEGQGPAGPQVPDGDQQVGSQKDEHIGPEPDGARQEPQKVDHAGLLLFRHGAGIPHLKTATSPAAGWFGQQPYHKAGFTVNRLGCRESSRRGPPGALEFSPSRVLMLQSESRSPVGVLKERLSRACGPSVKPEKDCWARRLARRFGSLQVRRWRLAQAALSP